MIKRAIVTLFLLVMTGVWIPLFSSCAFFHNDEGNPHMIGQKDAATFIGTIRPHRGDPESHYLLGCYLQERNKHKLAVEEFMRAVNIDPTHTRAYNGMGVSYDSLRQFSNAIEAYKTAIKLDPNLAYLHNNLGYSHLLNGNIDSAIDSFKKAVAFNDKNALYHNNLGLAYGMGGKYNLALDEFKLAVGEDMAHASLAKIIRRNGSPEEAAAQLAAAPMTKTSDRAHDDVKAAEILEEIFSSSRPVSTENEKRVVPESRHEATSQFAGAVMINPSPKTNLAEDTKKTSPSIPFDAPAGAQDDLIVVSELEHENVRRQNISGVKIEVSNGNGVNRMAKRVGEYLKNKGYLPVRVTNAENFNQLKTCIYFSRGFEEQAYRLAFLLPENHGFEMVSHPSKGNVAIRVVIGKDIAAYRAIFQEG